MARILYGVHGDRNGHVSRSSAIARQMPDHEFLFVGGGRAASIADSGYDVVPVPVLEAVTRHGRVQLVASAIAELRRRPGHAKVFKRLEDTVRDFDPDLIVTDFEYFTPRVAHRLGRTCIGVDRQHFLTHFRFDRPAGHHLARSVTAGPITLLQCVADRYLVVSFAQAEARDPARATLCPPVLRPAVEAETPRDDGHALVYLNGVSDAWIASTFGGRDRRVVVYGTERRGEEGNLVFRQEDRAGFVEDLAGAAYVVSHGGHNLICEALHLRKPLLALPIGLDYEQAVNAHLLKQAGCGAMARIRTARDALDAFERDLESYQAKLARYVPWRGRSVVSRLEDMVASGATGRDVSPATRAGRIDERLHEVGG